MDSSQEVTLEDARERLIINTINSLETSRKGHDEHLEQTDKKIEQLEGRLKETEESIRSSEIRGVQVLGTLAALIALILAYVDAATSQRDVLDAILILISATFGTVLFVLLLYQLLDQGKSRSSKYKHLLIVVIIGFFLTVAFTVAKTYFLDPRYGRTERTPEPVDVSSPTQTAPPKAAQFPQRRE